MGAGWCDRILPPLHPRFSLTGKFELSSITPKVSEKITIAAMGRNEGERRKGASVQYVDSGSDRGSDAFARWVGFLESRTLR
jgi:hypothetical protein